MTACSVKEALSSPEPGGRSRRAGVGGDPLKRFVKDRGARRKIEADVSLETRAEIGAGVEGYLGVLEQESRDVGGPGVGAEIEPGEVGRLRRGETDGRHLSGDEPAEQ